MRTSSDLFTPVKLCAQELPNRIARLPRIWIRADADGVPAASMARYYAQRAPIGFIITDGTQPARRRPKPIHIHM